MALLDFFKKKGKKAERPAGMAKKTRFQKAGEENVATKEENTGLKEKIPASLRAARTLIAPHVTEKSSTASEKGMYTFKVQDYTNKSEVKKAIQELYGVEVDAVHVINIHSKRRFSRGRPGMVKGYKKALVTLAKGQKIDLV